MATDRDFGEALLAECQRRLFDESLPRLKKCLGLMTEAQIWHRPNARTVSAGNLTLHLCGNAGQWIVAGLGGAPDTRRRDEEFSEPGPMPASELIARLDATMAEVRGALDAVDPASLLEPRPVQGFQESGLAILVHVTEHFSYHVGQIGYICKSMNDVDLAYYAGQDLSAGD